MIRHFTALAIGFLVAATAAQGPSDLLVVRADQNRNGDLHGTVRLDRGKGLSIAGAMQGQNTLWDLYGNTAVASVDVTPLFDPGEFPGGPNRVLITFEPTTLRPGQPFYGIIGLFDDPPGRSEADFRNIWMFDYEIEVDGVVVRGSELRYSSNAVAPLPPSPPWRWMNYFDVSQAIYKPGEHLVVYRTILRSTYTVINPPGIEVPIKFEFAFPIVIRGKPMN